MVKLNINFQACRTKMQDCADQVKNSKIGNMCGRAVAVLKTGCEKISNFVAPFFAKIKEKGSDFIAFVKQKFAPVSEFVSNKARTASEKVSSAYHNYFPKKVA